jgi:hypothetical protein
VGADHADVEHWVAPKSAAAMYHNSHTRPSDILLLLLLLLLMLLLLL